MSVNNKLIKLNLGCGSDYKKGYINVDIRNNIGADLVHDINTPFTLKGNIVSEVVAQDIFEHLTIEQQTSLLAELFRLMTYRGKLFVRIPNNEAIWKKFSNDPDVRNLFLFGDASESGVWGAHKSGHTLNSFIELARLSGFEIVKCSKVETNYEFEFIKKDKPKLHGVCLVNQSLSMGGAEVVLTQTLSWLQKQGIPIKAFVTQDRFKKDLESNNIATSKVPLVIDIIGDWKGFLKGISLFPLGIVYYGFLTYQNSKFGTILLSGYIEKILVTPWAKIFNVPIVWIEYGPLQNIFSKFFGLPKILYRLVSKFPNYIIEPSQHTRLSNLNISGLSSARTKIIPCGTKPLVVCKGVTEEYSAYCVSRMEEGKGQDILIKAWPKVLNRYPKAKLYLIGEGDFRIKLEKLVSKLKIEKSVVFLGWVDNLAKTISPLSLGVFPSIWPLEGFGVVLTEAMSLGKPIICFDASPYNEIVNSECAILVEKGDVDKLSEAIIKIFSDKKLAYKLGVNGKNRFQKYFSLEKTEPEYLNIFLKAQVASEVRKFLEINNV